MLSVIRALAGEGITMMIVTNEMKFARDVSSRIFYMDQGELYEDGPPEQIFGHPKKERTRAFVKGLEVFEQEITSRRFDFIEINMAIEEFDAGRFFPRGISTILNLSLRNCVSRHCWGVWGMRYVWALRLRCLRRMNPAW